ncbi:hypothetical protein B0T14DRAFT_62560 [Immersiella caudata]|uniref:Uncharacterized protein n=1 Tax=Immersiella caudata TaxID=314043 RepID=A0AA39XG16_9PEZI|nr:hypothetical protein B0T14DRAFT_62560 [Immersiella caudata]
MMLTTLKGRRSWLVVALCPRSPTHAVPVVGSSSSTRNNTGSVPRKEVSDHPQPHDRRGIVSSSIVPPDDAVAVQISCCARGAIVASLYRLLLGRTGNLLARQVHGSWVMSTQTAPEAGRTTLVTRQDPTI